MSALDDKAKNVSETAAEGEVCCEEQDGNPLGFGLLFFIIFLAVGLIAGWVVFPKLLYSQQKQPFNFDHALHNEEVDEGCESCHFYRDDGSYAGIPTLEQCIDCHEEVIGETEDEAIFVDEYVSKDREVPWLIYSKQPDCVFFSHSAHTASAKMECTECHGDIGTSDHLRVYEENRITGYSRDIWGKNIGGFSKNRMKMNDCARCHEKETGSKGACFQCHK